MATTYIGLYYPFIHFRDDGWLKLTSLYWDRMGRIVPEDYRLRDSDTVRELKDGGYVRDYHPAGAPAHVAPAFRELLATHGVRLGERYGLHLSGSWPDDPVTMRSRAAHFGDPKLAYVFGPKIDADLIDDLQGLGLASREGRRDPRWVGMHPRLASLYMLALAEAMAPRRGAQPITDDTLSHLAMGGFTMQRLAEGLLDKITEPQPRSDHEVEELMAGLTLEMAVPVSLEDVPTSKLVAFRERYAGERGAFQQQIHTMVSSLGVEGITDPEALRDHLHAQYEKTIRPQVIDLRRRLRDSHIETVLGLFNLKVTAPAGLSAAMGTFILPSGRAVLGAGAIALGVWRVWRDQSQIRRQAISESPAYAYLYHLEGGLPPTELADRIQHMGRRFFAGS